jgi:hypothetical protein
MGDWRAIHDKILRLCVFLCPNSLFGVRRSGASVAALAARRAEERQRTGPPAGGRGQGRGGAQGRMPMRTSAERSPMARSQQPLGVRLPLGKVA